MRPLLEWGSTGKRQRHARALAKNLLKLWPALWTFADAWGAKTVRVRRNDC